MYFCSLPVAQWIYCDLMYSPGIRLMLTEGVKVVKTWWSWAIFSSPVSSHTHTQVTRHAVVDLFSKATLLIKAAWLCAPWFISDFHNYGSLVVVSTDTRPLMSLTSAEVWLNTDLNQFVPVSRQAKLRQASFICRQYLKHGNSNCNVTHWSVLKPWAKHWHHHYFGELRWKIVENQGIQHSH